jgi:hypothetical protein
MVANSPNTQIGTEGKTPKMANRSGKDLDFSAAWELFRRGSVDITVYR